MKRKHEIVSCLPCLIWWCLMAVFERLTAHPGMCLSWINLENNDWGWHCPRVFPLSKISSRQMTANTWNNSSIFYDENNCTVNERGGKNEVVFRVIIRIHIPIWYGIWEGIQRTFQSLKLNINMKRFLSINRIFIDFYQKGEQSNRVPTHAILRHLPLRKQEGKFEPINTPPYCTYIENET